MYALSDFQVNIKKANDLAENGRIIPSLAMFLSATQELNQIDSDLNKKASNAIKQEEEKTIENIVFRAPGKQYQTIQIGALSDPLVITLTYFSKKMSSHIPISGFPVLLAVGLFPSKRVQIRREKPN